MSENTSDNLVGKTKRKGTAETPSSTELSNCFVDSFSLALPVDKVTIHAFVENTIKSATEVTNASLISSEQYLDVSDYSSASMNTVDDSSCEYLYTLNVSKIEAPLEQCDIGSNVDKLTVNQNSPIEVNVDLIEKSGLLNYTDNITPENSPELGESYAELNFDAPFTEKVEIYEEPIIMKATEKRGTNSASNENSANSTSRIEQELEQEMRYSMTLQKLRQVWEHLPSKNPDTMMWSVNVLQESVAELEDQLETLKTGEAATEEIEFKLRYEAQMSLNNKLEEQISWYEGEVAKMKEQNKKEEEHQSKNSKKKEHVKKGPDFSYDADLEDMTEFELAQLVKTLERDRNTLYGELRSKSWLLDNQSKEYFHYKELSRAYIGDLNHINRSLEYFWKQKAKDSIFAPEGFIPVTSPGSLKWSGETGIRPSQRILDAKKGPVRKTAGVRSLPRLDQEALEAFDMERKRTKSTNSTKNRHKSMVEMRQNVTSSMKGPKSATVGKDRVDDCSTSAEPTSEPSDDLTVD